VLFLFLKTTAQIVPGSGQPPRSVGPLDARRLHSVRH